MFKGQAKTDYMRGYMQRRRAALKRGEGAPQASPPAGAGAPGDTTTAATSQGPPQGSPQAGQLEALLKEFNNAIRLQHAVMLAIAHHFNHGLTEDCLEAEKKHGEPWFGYFLEAIAAEDKEAEDEEADAELAAAEDKNYKPGLDG